MISVRDMAASTFLAGFNRVDDHGIYAQWRNCLRFKKAGQICSFVKSLTENGVSVSTHWARSSMKERHSWAM